jgi:hypothetical protein
MLTSNQHVILFINEPWLESRPVKCIYINVLQIHGILKEIIVYSVEENIYYCLSPRYTCDEVDGILYENEIVLAIGKIMDSDILKILQQNNKSSIDIDSQQYEFGVKYYGIGSLFIYSIPILEYKYLDTWLDSG